MKWNVVYILFIFSVLIQLMTSDGDQNSSNDQWKNLAKAVTSTSTRYGYRRRLFTRKPYSIYRRRSSNKYPWQHEAPVTSIPQELIKLLRSNGNDAYSNSNGDTSDVREAHPNADEQRRLWMQARLYQIAQPDYASSNNFRRTSLSEQQPLDLFDNNNFGIHQIPGFDEQVNSRRPLQDDALDYVSGQSSVIPPKTNLVWNEDGKFWGYASNKTKGVRTSDGRAVYPNYSTYDDGSCVPPFCIPVRCPGSDLIKNCFGNCCQQQNQEPEQQCNPSCINGGICRNKTCYCPPGYFGPQCRVANSTVCKRQFRLDCEVGCANKDETFTAMFCVCRPWKRNDSRQCMDITLDVFNCPEACNSRGQCDFSTSRCICAPGFTGPSCGVRDFCRGNINQQLCEYKCVNLADRHQCICPSGFQLHSDGVSCVRTTPKCPLGLTGERCELDIDECLTGIHDCAQICVNKFGGFECKCHVGFQPDSRSPNRCKPIRCRPECIVNQGTCNTEGICQCRSGFRGKTCEYDIDECAQNIHDCQHRCVNTHGSYICKCNAGFEPDATNPNRCGAKSCVTGCVPGQGVCRNGRCDCLPGFQGRSCNDDVNECATGQHNCEHECLNTRGSFRCKCRAGFMPDLRSPNRCIQKECNPRCVVGQGDCDTQRERCVCRAGFSGVSCDQDVNECRDRIHNCEQNCVNIHGSYRCSCRPGFRVVPTADNRCRRVDCRPACVPGQGKCGSHGECVCLTGFSGIDCAIPDNVCKARKPCEQACHNLHRGNYRCSCWPGYKVNPVNPNTCKRLCTPGVDCIYGDCLVVYTDQEKLHTNATCQCHPGYEGKKCDLDVDECQGKHGCSQICRNSPGAYSCSCRVGYVLETDGKTCSRESGRTGCAGGCLNGGHCLQNTTCRCLPGYRGDRCEMRIDVCKERKPCQHECYNLAVSFVVDSPPNTKLFV